MKNLNQNLGKWPIVLFSLIFILANNKIAHYIHHVVRSGRDSLLCLKSAVQTSVLLPAILHEHLHCVSVELNTLLSL